MSVRAHAAPRLVLVALAAGLPSCLSPYESRHEGQWHSTDQIWRSDASQVRVRAVQSRVFDTKDRPRILEAVLATMQDEGFMIDMLDEELGLVSGKRFDDIESTAAGLHDPTYHLYDTDSLLMRSSSYPSWEPFFHRDNLVRVTVTVRKRNEEQSVVRASAQYYLRAVEDPLPYQRFFAALERSMYLQAHAFEDA
jgi:hypothetical protein